MTESVELSAKTFALLRDAAQRLTTSDNMYDRVVAKECLAALAESLELSGWPNQLCECGAMSLRACAEMPSRHCGLWEEVLDD